MGEERVPWLYLEQISPSCAVPPGSDTAVGAHFGRAGQGPEMDPQKARRLIKRTEVDEGEVTVGEAMVSEGEPARLTLVRAHPARVS
jgi:hypothetical protein